MNLTKVRRMSRINWLTLVLSISPLVVSCSETQPGTKVVQATGETVFPFETLKDARTFIDTLAVVHVTSEAIHKVEGDAKTEGYVPRSVELDVRDIIWARPGTSEPKRTLNILVTGYSFKSGELIPIVVDGAPRLEVGSDYLVALTDFGERGVGPVSSWAVLPLTGGVVSFAKDPPLSLARRFAGLSPREVGALIADTNPMIPDSVLGIEARLKTWNAQRQESGSGQIEPAS